MLTEAGTKRRAALYLVRGEAGLGEHDPGGLEVLDTDAATFHAALTRENHTLKRALTDPRILSGIGNAYSDEILHRAKLSPVKQTRQLSAEESARLLEATRATLAGLVRADSRGARPASSRRASRRSARAWPCTDATASRVRCADRRCSGSPTPTTRRTTAPVCQTGGRLLADRALSRLLKQDWPRTLEELEERVQAGRRGVSARSTSASEGVGPSL